MPNTDAFPERLRQAIGTNSVRTFGKMCGLSDAAIRKYLSGVNEPGMAALVAMAKAAEVDIEWLATGRGSPRGNEDTEDRTTQQIDNVVELAHQDIIKRFRDKDYAREVNMDLVELERINPDAYKKVGSYIKGLVDGLRMATQDKQRTPDRRSGRDRRDPNSPEHPQPGGERRTTPDRRKATGS